MRIELPTAVLMGKCCGHIISKCSPAGKLVLINTLCRMEHVFRLHLSGCLRCLLSMYVLRQPLTAY